VKALITLDADGNRAISKYYSKSSFLTVKDQKDFEKKIFAKTQNTSNEVVVIDSWIVIYRSLAELNFYVVGTMDDNELILEDMLNTYIQSLDKICRGQVDRRSFYENLDSVLLVLDELVDDGYIFETSPADIEARVVLKNPDDGPINEQNIAKTWKDFNQQFQKFREGLNNG